MSIGANAGNQKQQTDTFIDPNQQPFLDYVRANAVQQYDQNAPAFAAQSQLLGLGLSGQGNLGSQAQLGTALGATQATQNLAQLGSGINPFLQEQIQGLGGDIGRQLQSSLGNIGSGFGLSGQYGSSRQGLAEGEAITGALNEFGQQAANLRAGDLSRQTTANQALGQLQLQGANDLQAGLNDRFNLGLAPYTSQLAYLGDLNRIIGPPTAVSESKSKGFSGGFKVGWG